ncbi:hypothetical protein DPMN_076662 [Dreissena polymorpha]|uniref:Uncharacterized protein n=1 Tax=Dreissena polymorpha TaxID=45954 RepID=A0A9D4BNV6_DREPO|nr:hypothetical protein DPMN_076662 [Dreissena polymorpha]
MQEQQVTPVEVSENAIRNAKTAENNVIKICENKMQEQQVTPVEVSENAECNAKSAEDNAIKVGEKKENGDKENRTEHEASDIIHGLKVGDFVAAWYEGSVYVGKVLEIDKVDQDCKVTFMEKANEECYRWPKSVDIIWVKNEDIIMKLETPKSTRRSKRLFSIRDNERNIING